MQRNRAFVLISQPMTTMEHGKAHGRANGKTERRYVRNQSAQHTLPLDDGEECAGCTPLLTPDGYKHDPSCPFIARANCCR